MKRVRASRCKTHADKQWRRFLLNSGQRHGDRGARAYNGGLGAEPQRGPGAEVTGSGRRSPPEGERKLNFDTTITRLIVH